MTCLVSADMDKYIFSYLDKYDLANVHLAEISKVTEEDNFWFRRIQLEFPFLSIEMLNKFKTDTWYDYYIELNNTTDFSCILPNPIDRLDLTMTIYENFLGPADKFLNDKLTINNYNLKKRSEISDEFDDVIDFGFNNMVSYGHIDSIQYLLSKLTYVNLYKYILKTRCPICEPDIVDKRRKIKLYLIKCQNAMRYKIDQVLGIFSNVSKKEYLSLMEDIHISNYVNNWKDPRQ